MAEKVKDVLAGINNTEHRIALENLFKSLLDINLSQWRIGNRHVATTNGIDTLQFNTSFEDGFTEGRLNWDADNHTLSFGLAGDSLNLMVGQHNVTRVFNKTGVDIAKGKVVYVDGHNDSKPRIALADNDNVDSNPEAVVVGITAELIAADTQGYIVTAGTLTGLDTDDLTEGEVFWLGTTPGSYTKTKPTAPNRSIRLGYCLRKHSSQGVILLNIVALPLLIGLSDVKAAPPSDGKYLQWSEANKRWEQSDVFRTAETTTPTPEDSIGKVYCKADNKLYFQDGAGVEHEIAFV